MRQEMMNRTTEEEEEEEEDEEDVILLSSSRRNNKRKRCSSNKISLMPDYSRNKEVAGAQHPSEHSTASSTMTELIVVSQALLDSSCEYTKKQVSLLHASRSYDDDEEFTVTRKSTSAVNVNPAEITFCNMLAQDVTTIVESKNSIALQNHYLALEKKHFEERRKELQSELFLLHTQTQQLKGECRALQKKKNQQELVWMSSANDTITNLERLVSYSCESQQNTTTSSLD
jgi:hypothetical protein